MIVECGPTCDPSRLIATTALVATAGVAAADVKLSGNARFGAIYSDATEEVTSSSRFRLQVDVSTETDGGLTLGARQRFQVGQNTGGATGNGVRFFGSAGGLTIAMGNIIGVVEAAPNLYLPTKSAGVGLAGNGFSSLAANTESNGGVFGWTAYNSGGAGAQEGVEVIYSMNGIGLHAHSTEDSYGLGANYKFGDYTVAVAYEEFDNDDTILFLSAGGKFGAFDAAIAYAETEFGGVSADKVSLKGGYNVNDGLYVYGFVANESNGVDESFGLGASYALGGGASVEAGWTQNAAGTNLVSAGIFFSF